MVPTILDMAEQSQEGKKITYFHFVSKGRKHTWKSFLFDGDNFIHYFFYLKEKKTGHTRSNAGSLANYWNDELVVYLIVVKSIIQGPIKVGALNGSILNVKKNWRFFHELVIVCKYNTNQCFVHSIRFSKTFFIWLIRYVPISSSIHSYLICFEKFSNI